MKLYIESSVVNFVYADDAPDKAEITKNFFESSVKSHELFISELVLEEIEKTQGPKKEKMSNFVIKLGFRVLPKRINLHPNT